MRLEGSHRLAVSLGLGLTVSAGVVLVLVALLAPPRAAAQTPPTTPSETTVTFEYTGRPQTWTVPAGVSSARFDVFGAQGGVSCFQQQRLGGPR
jgi:hypothetical protein